MEQPFVLSEREATEEEISDYMTSIGFEEDYSDEFHNEDYSVFDAVPNNVLMGIDGKLYFIDTQIAPIEKESKEEDPEKYYRENNPQSEEHKKSRSSLGDAINENPLNGNVSEGGGASLSTVNTTKNTTKLQYNSQTAKNKIQKAMNEGISSIIKKPEQSIKFIANILNLRYTGSSWYNEFATPNGTMTIRLSHHRANGNNFNRNNSKNNISLVIERYVRDGQQGTIPYSEYVYLEESIAENLDRVIKSILKGVAQALETGKFVDISSLAEVSHYNAQSPFAQTTFGRKRVIEQRAIDLAASLNTPIHLADYSELPKNHKKAKGFYDPKNGEIVIFPENHRNESDIESTVLHEVVAHKGLRELFGNHFNEFLETLYKDSTPSVKAKITALSQIVICSAKL